MGVRPIVVLLTGLSLTLALPGPARAQSDPVKPTPAVQDAASNPIGKIVNASGAVTIERTNAVVIQVSVAG